MKADTVRRAWIAGFQRRASLLRATASAMLFSLLAGCVFDSQQLILTDQQLKERTPYVAVSTGRAWVNAPMMRGVLERDLRNGLEQKIGLANDTSVAGDNVMLIRAQSGVAGFGRLRFERVIANFGGLPSPFSRLSAGELVQGKDEIGTYFWAAQDIEDARCVLGIRRVNSGMRQLPNNSNVMDIVLRNCVTGTHQDALAPLLASSIGIAPIARDEQGKSRMLSPLAAPSATSGQVLTDGMHR